MLVATVIHTQEVSNQHVPFTTVHCEGKNTEHRGLRPTSQSQPGCQSSVQGQTIAPMGDLELVT